MTTHTAPHASAKDRAQELRDRIDGSLDRLASAIDTVRASEEFRAYLDIQAKFHRYSWHNTMLIYMQRPDATRVAGYRAWQKLGRQVCKGERAVRIFAPCPFKRTVKTDDGETEERKGIYFKIASVFDIAQTTGEALPDVDVPDLDVAADTLLAGLERVAGTRGIAVNYTDLPAGHYGSSKGGAIDLATGHATGQHAKTLTHELAHEALHKDKETRKGLDRNTAELEAESVAYVVCRHFGLDAEVRSSRYIALWGGDSKGLRTSLERISKTARGIIDDVEGLDGRKAVA